MLNRELEVTLNLAFKDARAKRHEFMTVEHLLLALLDNEAAANVLRACAANMDKPAGSAIYTALLTEQGTYASDITAQLITDQHYRLFVGTAAIKRDLAWLRRHAEGYDVALTDSTEDYAVLGLILLVIGVAILRV